LAASEEESPFVFDRITGWKRINRIGLLTLVDGIRDVSWGLVG
jgi:hypothetical protein